MLPDIAIEEFQELYLIEYGQKISKDEAKRQASKLIHLLKIIYQDSNNEAEL